MTNKPKITFFCFYSWLLKLDLTLCQRVIFAAIHNFTKNAGCYSGSREYLASLCGCTVRTVREAVDRLEELKLVAVSRGRNLRIESLVTDDDAEAIEAETAEAGKRFPLLKGKGFPEKGKRFPEKRKEFPEKGKSVPPIMNINKNKSKEEIKLSPAPAGKESVFGGSNEAVSEKPPEAGSGSNGAEMKKAPTCSELEAEFEELWKKYPRREGRAKARLAYIAARRSGASRETIEKGVTGYAGRVSRLRIEPRYIKQGGNFFAEKGWQDGEHVFSSPLPSAAASAPPPRAAPVNRALDYPQRQYSAKDLEVLGIDLGEGVYDDGG